MVAFGFYFDDSFSFSRQKIHFPIFFHRNYSRCTNAFHCSPKTVKHGREINYGIWPSCFNCSVHAECITQENISRHFISFQFLLHRVHLILHYINSNCDMQKWTAYHHGNIPLLFFHNLPFISFFEYFYFSFTLYINPSSAEKFPIVLASFKIFSTHCIKILIQLLRLASQCSSFLLFSIRNEKWKSGCFPSINQTNSSGPSVWLPGFSARILPGFLGIFGSFYLEY